jgi:phosphonate transport system substrate-binding protein
MGSSSREQKVEVLYKMATRLYRWIVLSVLLVGLLIGTSASDAAEKEITIAILPCFDIVMAFQKFHPLITYLEEQTGHEIKMMVQTNFSEFELAIRNGDIDFVLQDPHTYVRLANLYNEESLLIALTDKGSKSRRGVIIVRKDSGIEEVGDLRGKTVMFGPKQSIAKWIAAKILLEKNGIDIDKDLRAYRNGECCDDIAFNVYLEGIDAGAVCEHFISGDHAESQKKLGIDMDQLAVIGWTPLVPTKVFAARKMVSSDLVAKVVDALLSIDIADPAQAEMLLSAELGGFEKVTDKDFDGIRELIGMKQ